MADYFDGSRKGRRRDLAFAGGVLLAAFVLYFLPPRYQTPIRDVVRATALRPFIAMQSGVVHHEQSGVDVNVLSAERDSLAAVVAAQASLAEENRRLRALLALRPRAGAAFVPAELLSLGVGGAESTFLLDVGSADGVQVGSPVIAPGGLVGVVKDVGPHLSQAIDWTNPDFRASAMTADGTSYGIVEPRQEGSFREDDLLALTGAPFHSEIAAGTRVVTSGRGGIYPRGVPLGTVVGIDEADTGWRKSYLLRPAVRPEGVTHVLVGLPRARAYRGDISDLWSVQAAPDTVAARLEGQDSLHGTGAPAKPTSQGSR